MYYSLKRSGSPIVDLHRLDPVKHEDRVMDGAAMADADAPGVYDRAGKRTAFIRGRDVFVRDTSSGRLTQITRSPQPKGFNLEDLLFSTLRISAPLVLASLGGLLTFKAGILNIALDGFMIIAAFAAVAGQLRNTRDRCVLRRQRRDLAGSECRPVRQRRRPRAMVVRGA